jgi:D-beta-D-heptose 7-phosphate kinase/D-beta-D-heptose 1-phosphate adenosyltransferase
MEATSQYRAAAHDNVKHRALRIIKGTASFEDQFVPDHVVLVNLIEMLRSMGCVIVFITGVWDLIHIGHAEYIRRGREEAAKLYPNADHFIVVIGADSDDLTKRRKGPERPIVPEGERVKVLSHLRAVDLVTLQTESDQLFRIIPHEVRVISESTKDLPGLEKIRAQCEHLVNLPPQAETSTTARIRRLSIDGAVALLLKVEQGLTQVLKEVRDGLKG